MLAAAPYFDIIKAIQHFDIRYCIWTGAYGSVYKTQLPCDKVVALKKLHIYEAEVPSFDASFKNENHVFDLSIREKGSLFSFLYDDVEVVEFNWRKRLNE
ncbi:LRR kinase family protein, putative [Medicago truncatula]|uniref:non-specific serine/threonine protein kinase n=1 Tax=Medicago truncatula TaxID=3880 RepID=G7L291_MEDTR|nr:LRR kinase family protein, putative [Medicago truncatula]